MKKFSTTQKISKIETTSDTITGRAGLAFINRYIQNTGILEILVTKFRFLRKSSKGLGLVTLFKQIILFFFDGTSRHLSYFDNLKNDKGYAAAIEELSKNMASSHTVKRFVQSFPLSSKSAFRKILKKIFIERLRNQQPQIVILTLDTMVMNNDEALKRQGVQPTYKKVKGFQPLQLIWNGFIVDAIFRGGKKHSNSGSGAITIIQSVVKCIREEYDENVTIILRVDSGFYDELNFKAYDNLNIGFVGSGKMYKGVKEHVSEIPEENWSNYDNGKQEWGFCEFGYRGDSWSQYWRAIYTRPQYADKQKLLDFERPSNVILTNIGINPNILKNLPEDQQAKWTKTTTIIANHHDRGADELPHRGLKDFGFEQLPFKKFHANQAFYYLLLISFFLFESYKRDVTENVIPAVSYATTFRRILIDFAGKIIKTGHQRILKISKGVIDSLCITEIWERCNHPPSLLN